MAAPQFRGARALTIQSTTRDPLSAPENGVSTTLTRTITAADLPSGTLPGDVLVVIDAATGLARTWAGIGPSGSGTTMPGVPWRRSPGGAREPGVVSTVAGNDGPRSIQALVWAGRVEQYSFPLTLSWSWTYHEFTPTITTHHARAVLAVWSGITTLSTVGRGFPGWGQNWLEGIANVPSQTISPSAALAGPTTANHYIHLPAPAVPPLGWARSTPLVQGSDSTAFAITLVPPGSSAIGFHGPTTYVHRGTWGIGPAPGLLGQIHISDYRHPTPGGPVIYSDGPRVALSSNPGSPDGTSASHAFLLTAGVDITPELVTATLQMNRVGRRTLSFSPLPRVTRT